MNEVHDQFSDVSDVLARILVAMSDDRVLRQRHLGGWTIARLPSGPWSAEKRQGTSLHFIVAWTPRQLAEKIRAACD
jgi:hypothetical protein